MTEQDTSAVDTDSPSTTPAPQHDAPAADVTDISSAEVSGDVEAAPNPTSLLEREGEVAADFLEQLLDIADMDGDIDVDVDGDRAAVAIVDSEEGRVWRPSRS